MFYEFRLAILIQFVILRANSYRIHFVDKQLKIMGQDLRLVIYDDQKQDWAKY